MAKYKPDVNSSIEETVFDGHDNPSPLLEIVEQQIAKQAKGNVTVYIENIRDISALRNVLKVSHFNPYIIYSFQNKIIRYG